MCSEDKKNQRLIIPIAEKGFLPTSYTWGYVVGKTRSHYSRHS
jgi:hypothetical protein